jgi:diacylglycerol O-acyltransferase / wax synthase
VSKVDRLSAHDLMMLWPEEFGWSQDIGALAILDGGGLLDADGRFSIEQVREQIRRRLHLVPRFRQLLYQPRLGLGWPLWTDAPGVDIAEHVQEFRLRTPADEPRLLLACEELRRRGLDRSRPLWEMWFLTGLVGGRVGLFIKVHHAIADGVAGVAALGAFVDAVPDPPEMGQPPWTPAAMPSARELLDDNLRQRRGELGRTLTKLAHPADTARQARRGWPAAREAFVEARAPRTSLTQRIGWHRRFALVRSNLEVVKRTAHAHDAKVNDVLLTVVASGLRDLLRGRGEPVDGVVLRAFVPVSLHTGVGQARGNRDGAMLVPLPVGEPDELRRLRLIAAETAARKKKSRPAGGTLFRNAVIQRAALRAAPHQRVMNTYAANVPGPPVPLYFVGAPILEMFPVVPLMANVSVGVGALSYAGQFNLTAVADKELCPDLEVFADGARRSLEVLAASVGVHAS